MKPELDELKITPRELEILTGVEVNEIFIGGVLGGVYRPSIFRSFKRLASFCITEILVFASAFIFTLPFGFLIVRNSVNAVTDLNTIFRFLQLTLGMTLIVILGWNLYMRLKVKSLKTLANLLDDVDRYNEVIQAFKVFDQLEAIRSSPDPIDRNQIIEALKVTRSSLTCGLMTEKILRENRSILARRYDLFATIENNMASLRAIEFNSRANEYTELLNRAFQIGMSVHQELQKFSQY